MIAHVEPKEMKPNTSTYFYIIFIIDPYAELVDREIWCTLPVRIWTDVLSCRQLKLFVVKDSLPQPFPHSDDN